MLEAQTSRITAMELRLFASRDEDSNIHPHRIIAAVWGDYNQALHGPYPATVALTKASTSNNLVFQGDDELFGWVSH